MQIIYEQNCHWKVLRFEDVLREAPLNVVNRDAHDLVFLFLVILARIDVSKMAPRMFSLPPEISPQRRKFTGESIHYT